MMTKKHFEEIAENIKGTNFETPGDKFKFIRNLCSFFKSENENFDRQEFAKACYDLEEEFHSRSEMRRITNKI